MNLLLVDLRSLPDFAKWHRAGLWCWCGGGPEDKLHGEASNTAYHIGEDLVKVAKSCAQDVWLVACRRPSPSNANDIANAAISR